MLKIVFSPLDLGIPSLRQIFVLAFVLNKKSPLLGEGLEPVLRNGTTRTRYPRTEDFVLCRLRLPVSGRA